MKRRNIFLRILLLLSPIAGLLTGCSSVPILSRDPVAVLRSDIDSLLVDSLFTSTLAGIRVESLASGEVLYDRSSSLLLRPASNTKILTSSSALLTLGTGYTFRTELRADSIDSNGIVQGNVYLKGYGDPDLRTADLDSLAILAKAAGVSGIRGDVVADASYFDDQYWPLGWMWDDEVDPDGAAVSALSVNKNCVRLTASPDSLTHSTVTVDVNPPTSYVTLVNNARIVTDSVRVPLSMRRLFVERTNIIVVEGEMLPGAPPTSMRIALWKPEAYAAQLMLEALKRQSIPVDGSVWCGLAQENARTVGTILHPIDSMVINLDKISDNLSAENTLKTLGAAVYGPPGTSRSGLWAVNRALSAIGVDTTVYRFVDGSGVSHYNLVPARTLVQILRGMVQRTDLFPLFYAALPIAGVDGTIGTRMRGTPAQGNLRAKTGTISGVSSLSGYVTTRDGEMLVFSMMMQNFIRRSDYYRAVQDSIGARLAAFSRSRGVASR